MIWDKKELNKAIVNDEWKLEQIKKARKDMNEDLDKIEMKETIKTYKNLLYKNENIVNNIAAFVRHNKNVNQLYYLDDQGVLFDDEEELKQAHIDEYLGLDDEMADWYPESEELNYRAVIEKMLKGEL